MAIGNGRMLQVIGKDLGKYAENGFGPVFFVDLDLLQ